MPARTTSIILSSFQMPPPTAMRSVTHVMSMPICSFTQARRKRCAGSPPGARSNHIAILQGGSGGGDGHVGFGFVANRFHADAAEESVDGVGRMTGWGGRLGR